jgi:hypothetical protein
MLTTWSRSPTAVNNLFVDRSVVGFTVGAIK